jgi:hypothetical protein
MIAQKVDYDNVILYNIESIVINEADGNALYSIVKGDRPKAHPIPERFKPVEFFNDEHGNRWVKFWPKNGPAKGKQASIPIERLIMVIHG